MAIMKIIQSGKPLGDIEAEFVPAIGDTFHWEKYGPYRVLDRIWNFPAEYNDVAHRVTLEVEKI